MQQKTYKLSVLPLFEEDLNEIVDYITNKLQNPDAALRLVDDIHSIQKAPEGRLSASGTMLSMPSSIPYSSDGSG